MRLRGIAFTALALAFTALPSAWAAWPEDRAIEIVVGFAPGGGTDLLARKLTPFLQKRLGGKAQFVVVNKPGASGEIANAYLAQAKPDGYTIGVVNVPAFLYVPMVKKSQYKVEDFRLIARLVDDPTVLVTRADSKFNSLSDVIAELRRKPGSVSFGHNGTGSNGDLALVALSSAAGVQVNAIPYKGTSAQRTDLLGGHLNIGVISAGEVAELHGGKTGQLKALTQFSEKRSSALPQVPTATDEKVAVLMSSERGFAAPAAVPAEIVKKLQDAVEQTLHDPEFIAAAGGDAPVLAYLSGAQWQQSLQKNSKMLSAIADKAPKQ
jgi:tripartite-type tricarboxylate transporter receptor subunit TctC